MSRQRELTISSALAEDELGWRGIHSWRETMSMTLDWYARRAGGTPVHDWCSGTWRPTPRPSWGLREHDARNSSGTHSAGIFDMSRLRCRVRARIRPRPGVPAPGQRVAHGSRHCTVSDSHSTCRFCPACGLGQVGEYVLPERIFGDYPYLSSMSSSWLEHVRTYARTQAAVMDRRGWRSWVLEVASNDGYLLREFRDLGIGTWGRAGPQRGATWRWPRGSRPISEFFGGETGQADPRWSVAPRGWSSPTTSWPTFRTWTTS